MLSIVVSRADDVSLRIGEQLRSIADWTAHDDAERPAADGGGRFYRTEGVELRTFEALHIELETPAAAFSDPTFLVFASRHSGETGPLLTAHHTGNVGPAEYGGEANTLARAAPRALSAVLEAFDTHAPEGFETGLECTHHGPTAVGAPSLFVEVGSEQPDWQNEDALAAAARSILELRSLDPMSERSVVGLGGGHYVPRFTRIVRETDWTVGHLLADWGIRAAEGLAPPLLQQAFERSGARHALIDGDYPDLESTVEGLGYRVVGETWIRETIGVSLEFVERLEADIATIDEGLRFGSVATSVTDTTGIEVLEPSRGLLADANGIDHERVRDAVEADAVAYETVDAGHRVNGRVAVVEPVAWERIERSLVELLRERFDRVVVEPESIQVVERAFDPERARELGVEPGPAFGRLADGEAVRVDGREIQPEAVHDTRTRRYAR